MRSRIRRFGYRLAVLCLIGLLATGGSWAVEDAERPPLRTAHFEIGHVPADADLARRTGEILEAGVAEFSGRLPVGDQMIRVEICHTSQAFREMAGRYGLDRVGGITEAARSLIVLKSPDIMPPDNDYGGIVRHELLHMLLSRNTAQGNVPRWLEEGIAMVLSRELRWESGFRLASMYMRHRLIAYPDLDISFAPAGGEERFGDAYAQALSMTQHLAKHLGEERFWRLVADLRTAPFETVLMRYAAWTPGDLYDSWRRTLWKLAVVAVLVSGFSVFQFAALLVVLAYWRKRRHGQRILKEWEEQEAFERAWGPDGPPALDTSEEWQEEGDEDDEDEHVLR